MRPSSGQLGTGSGNGLIEFGIPTDYKTQEHDHRGGLQRQDVERQARLTSTASSATARDTRSGRTSTCATRSTPRCCRRTTTSQKWTLSGVVARPAAGIRRSLCALHAEQAHQQLRRRRAAASSRRSNAVAPPTGVGYLVTAPSSSTFDGDTRRRRRTVVAARRRRSTGLDTRALLRVLRQAERLDADLVCGRRAAGARQRPCGSSSATQFCMGALRGARATSSTRRTSRPRPQLPDRRAPEAPGGSTTTCKIDRDARAGAEDRRQRGSGSSTATRSGRHADRAPQVPVPAAALGPQPQLHEQQHPTCSRRRSRTTSRPTTSRTSTRTWSSSTSTGTRCRCWSIGFGATWRKTDYKDLYYGRTDDTTPAVRPVGQLRRPGQVPHHRHRQLGRGRSSTRRTATPPIRRRARLPGRHADGDDVRLGHGEHPGQLAGRAAGRLGADGQAAADGVGTAGAKTDGGVDFWSGNYAGCRRLQRRPAGQLRDRQHRDAALPAEGRLHVSTRTGAAPPAYWYEKYDYNDDQMRGYAGLLPVLPEPGHEHTSFGTTTAGTPARSPTRATPTTSST